MFQKEKYLDVQEFTYDLPEDRIAKYPLEGRDSSKLLVYKDAKIIDVNFKRLPDHLPSNSLLIFNNTKVIAARLLFSDVFNVEVFLLEPFGETIEQTMVNRQEVVWHCMVGNLKKWRKSNKTLSSSAVYEGSEVTLEVELVQSEDLLVKLKWNNNSLHFAHILNLFGKIPLPPYLNRDTEAKDHETYQTIYAKEEGAVAAPTAGLHFTDRVFTDLENKGHSKAEVTLHVSAGTFAPIKTVNALAHAMHRELIKVDLATLKLVVDHNGPIIPVGTTSMRTLESLYWFGISIIRFQDFENEGQFTLDQHYAYSVPENELVSYQESYKALLDYCIRFGLSEVIGQTEIYIYPSYQMQVCKGLVTNFHQPGSTLMLLVAALVGQNWKTIYDHALTNDYRFLSYGDSSLLLP